MNDQHTFRDHRLEAAMATADRRAVERGWDLRPDSGAARVGSFVGHAAAILFRPYTLGALTVLGACIWLLINYGGG